MDIDFFAGIVQSGTVLGVDADLDPSVVARVLGEYDYMNSNSGAFWWGYDIVEIFWRKRPHRLGFAGSHFSVQTHRLSSRNRPLRFSDLRAALTVPLVEVPGSQPDPDFTDFRAPDSGMVVIVHLADDEVHKIYSQFGKNDSELVSSAFATADSAASEQTARACIDALTGTMSRADKRLIDAARLHRHVVTDPLLSASLDSWIARRNEIPGASLPRL